MILPNVPPEHSRCVNALPSGERPTGDKTKQLWPERNHPHWQWRHRHLCDTRHRRANTRGFLTTCRRSSRTRNTIGCISTPVSLVSLTTLSRSAYSVLSPLQRSLRFWPREWSNSCYHGLWTQSCSHHGIHTLSRARIINLSLQFVKPLWTRRKRTRSCEGINIWRRQTK